VGGSLMDLLYVFSAMASFVAFMRPTYMSNRIQNSKYRLNHSFLNKAIDFVYGENIRPSSRFLGGIKNRHHKLIIAGLLRSIVRAVLLPLSVFSAFYKNFNLKYAVSFAMIATLLAMIFGN
jgi:hypothetical protein